MGVLLSTHPPCATLNLRDNRLWRKSSSPGSGEEGDRTPSLRLRWRGDHSPSTPCLPAEGIGRDCYWNGIVNVLRSLIYRQLFLLLDVALSVLVVGAAVLLVTVILKRDSSSMIAKADFITNDEVGTITRTVPVRTHYSRIVESGIFGSAASTSRDEVLPEPEPEIAEEADTELPLRLFGTVVSGPNDRLATAVIEITDGPRNIGTYYLDQEVMTGVTLKEIKRKEVLLENSLLNRIEHLRIVDKEEPKLAPPPGRNVRRPAQTQRRTAGPVVVLDQKKIVRQLTTDYNEIASQLDVEVVLDDKGNVQGLTASNLSSVELAKDFGLQDGDVLTTVNGQKIDSVESVYDVLTRYQNATSFTIGIMRNGRRQNITYRLR